MGLGQTLKSCKKIVDGRKINKSISGRHLHAWPIVLCAGENEVLDAFGGNHKSNVSLINRVGYLDAFVYTQVLCLWKIELWNDVLHAMRDLLVVAIASHASAVRAGVRADAIQ